MKVSSDCDDPFGLRGSVKAERLSVILPRNTRIPRRAILFEEEKTKSHLISTGERELLNNQFNLNLD